jgi:class 3 adenylate cyclase
MPAAARTRSFTVAVPFDRVLRALAECDADAELECMLDATAEVTVMFGDLEGFTPLTERLGDAGVAQVLHQLDWIVRDGLTAHHGHRATSSGDGFMALFAEPADALRAAIQIQRALAGAPIRMRIGVHAGPLVRVRTGRDASDVAGRNVILASRISDAARGGEVLVSSAVRRLTEPLGEFRFGRHRRLALKGLSGLHDVVELVWRTTHRRSPWQIPM